MSKDHFRLTAAQAATFGERLYEPNKCWCPIELDDGDFILPIAALEYTKKVLSTPSFTEVNFTDITLKPYVD